MTRQTGGRAVVLGAGIAGLLAAHVLTESYGQVTVIDRDELPQTPTHRRGIPTAATCMRWPRAASKPWRNCSRTHRGTGRPGAPAGSLLANARLYLSGHPLRQADTGLVLLCASRPFLEAHVRARVRALPNVTVLDRRDIVGLATTPDGRRVTGAQVLRRADNSTEELLGAELVVDATGRAPAPQHGWKRSATPDRSEQVRIGLGYATRTYRLPPDALDGDLAVLQAATPSIHGPGPSRGSKATGGC